MKGIDDPISPSSELPPCAMEYIARVVRGVRYRKKVRRDIEAELMAHFEDELRNCATADERDAKARKLIEEFGDPKLLGVLCRRAKKRCRPLWKKTLMRTGQVLGILVLYTVICMLPMVLGKPVVRVNYIEWLNERWKPRGAEVVNAKQYYDQAAKLYVEPPEPVKNAINAWGATLGNWDQADREALGAWLAANRAAFDAFRQGGNTEHYWPVYVGSPPRGSTFMGAFQMQADVMSYVTMAAGKYRKVAAAFRQQIAYEASGGHTTEAFDDCLVLQRVGRHLEGKNSLTEQLIGVAIEQSGYDGIFTILKRPDLGATVLERVQKGLLAAFDEKRRVINLDCEKAFWYDMIQRTFTDDGHGGGHALGPGFIYAAGTWGGNLARTFLFHYPDRREAIAVIDRYFERAEVALTVPPARIESERPWEKVSRAASESVLLSLMGPVHEGMSNLEWRAKTYEAAAVTAVAIFRYKLDKGQYPARLEELVEAGYLPSLPADPFGNGPLSYRRMGDDFLLYSWGPDLSDGGGLPSTDNRGKLKMWTDNNDWVFWPLQTSSK
jgi:hypothetical protein